jgi:hypothetical protein
LPKAVVEAGSEWCATLQPGCHVATDCGKTGSAADPATSTPTGRDPRRRPKWVSGDFLETNIGTEKAQEQNFSLGHWSDMKK